jgi:hypothetical protein
MDSEKKPYTTPQLKAYGKLEEITQQNGISFFDLPIGGGPPSGPGPIGPPPGRGPIGYPTS